MDSGEGAWIIAHWWWLVLWAMTLLIAFLKGWLMSSQEHLADLRSHAKWTDDFTREVVKIIDDLAANKSPAPDGEPREEA